MNVDHPIVSNSSSSSFDAEVLATVGFIQYLVSDLSQGAAVFIFGLHLQQNGRDGRFHGDGSVIFAVGVHVVRVLEDEFRRVVVDVHDADVYLLINSSIHQFIQINDNKDPNK